MAIAWRLQPGEEVSPSSPEGVESSSPVTGKGDYEGGEGSEAYQWRVEPIFATIITAELNREREG